MVVIGDINKNNIYSNVHKINIGPGCTRPSGIILTEIQVRGCASFVPDRLFYDVIRCQPMNVRRQEQNLSSRTSNLDFCFLRVFIKMSRDFNIVINVDSNVLSL